MTATLTVEDIRRLSELAFVLEPLLDKSGCTTRYVDLPGKPLADFLIAGINTGEVISDYADSVINHGNQQIFSHFYDALAASNAYKAKKYITVGLLEVMFITIKVRLSYPTLDEALNSYIPVLQAAPKADIPDYVRAFELAWSTSVTPGKRDALQGTEAKSDVSFYDWHNAKTDRSTDPTSSEYQFGQYYHQGFPIIKQFVSAINPSQGVLHSLELTYDDLHREQPILKVGGLADQCAAALFLYLSYQDKDAVVLT